jgi:hypothetical protein
MHNDKMIKSLIFICLLIVITAPLFVGEAQAKDKGKSDIIRVHRLVMNFADNYAANMLQSNNIFKQRISDASARAEFMNMTLFSISTAYDIASGYSPHHKLVNMMVLVTLQRIVWEEHWQPNVFGSQANFHLEILKQLEKDIWSLAGKEYSAEQLSLLMELIQAWHKAHPEQNIVVSIRFTDFASLKKEFQLAESKGLFSSISKAVDAAEELHLLGERLRYQMSRMQLLLNYQLEVAYMQLINQPEIGRLMQNSDKFAAAADQFTQLSTKLPEITQNVFAKLETESAQLRDLLKTLNQTVGSGNELAVEVNRTISLIDALIARFDPIRAKDGVEHIDIEQFRGLTRDLSEGGRQLTDLLQMAGEFLSDEDKEKRLANFLETLENIQRRGEQLIDLIFYRILLIVVTVLLGSFLLAIVYRYIGNRFFEGDAAK